MTARGSGRALRSPATSFAIGAVVAGIVIVAVLSSNATSGPASGPPPPMTAFRSTAAALCDGPGGTPVSDGAQLTKALAGAGPGAVIRMAPGRYSGAFVAKVSGTADRPVTLCGPRDAVVDGGGVGRGYALHLDGASYWRLSGFTIRGAQKGLMLDNAKFNVVEGLLIEGTGDEAMHLRKFSSDNIVRGNEIRNTGLGTKKYGEGIYVGSAESNWCSYSSCKPDRSDRNTIEFNTISGTSAESVDIKEGTRAGVLRGNSFSGAGMTEADSWVDVKGNSWLIADNIGVDAPEDGFQLHQALTGWGLDNTFTGNRATVNADGYGINITKNQTRNRVTCSNTAIGAGKGLSNVKCVAP